MLHQSQDARHDQRRHCGTEAPDLPSCGPEGEGYGGQKGNGNHDEWQPLPTRLEVFEQQELHPAGQEAEDEQREQEATEDCERLGHQMRTGIVGRPRQTDT